MTNPMMSFIVQAFYCFVFILRWVTVNQRTKKLGYHISPWIPLNIYIKNSTLVISEYLAADIMIMVLLYLTN